MNKQTVMKFAKNKFLEGAKGHEIGLMLLALVKQGKFDEDDILDALNYIHDNNVNEVLNTLLIMKEVANDDLIEEILKGVN